MEKCSQCSLKLHAKHVNIRDSVIVLVASDYSASLFNCLFSGKPCSACDLAIAGGDGLETRHGCSLQIYCTCR